MQAAHRLATHCLPNYSDKFSRHDFTLPQLFACLVVREHQKKSFRGVEALLRDCPDWLADIGMDHAPDHNTVWRAFDLLVKRSTVNSMLDLQTQWAEQQKLIKGRIKPVAFDSSMFESRHVSRHFEKRQRQSERGARKKRRKTGGKSAGDRRRSRVVRGLPKLSLAVATSCHLILAARATTGGGGDQRFFEPLLFDAWRRVNIKTAVADAGYDSEDNHCIARQDMGVRSIIPPNSGRPTEKLPTARHRRNMHLRFKRKADQKIYGQRWQAETVNSMIKRNLDSALRARTPGRRSRELLIRVVTHNIMILQ
jgi:Transposase DDE domain